ncbi:unnamed protein product [Caenorhabditis bovis]|uniref:Uncharacterized protein n=1 Tax=Caenorhabditis bovis TaxID=2654633 RepID=A0A8S1FFY5_9PELO|nr:unnamed protein product [Caenorhabditis bovis]
MEPECERFWNAALVRIGQLTLDTMFTTIPNDDEAMNYLQHVHNQFGAIFRRKSECSNGNHHHDQVLEILDDIRERMNRMLFRYRHVV